MHDVKARAHDAGDLCPVTVEVRPLRKVRRRGCIDERPCMAQCEIAPRRGVCEIGRAKRVPDRRGNSTSRVERRYPFSGMHARTGTWSRDPLRFDRTRRPIRRRNARPRPDFPLRAVHRLCLSCGEIFAPRCFIIDNFPNAARIKRPEIMRVAKTRELSHVQKSPRHPGLVGPLRRAGRDIGGLSSTQNVFAAEIFTFERPTNLQYIFVRLQGDPTKELIGLGSGAESRAFNRLSEFTPIPVTANASGNVVVQVDAACVGAGLRIQATVTVWFV